MDDTVNSMRYFGSDVEFDGVKEDIAFAAELGLSGKAGSADLDRLAHLKHSPYVLVRGYAAWAWRKLHPIPKVPQEYHVSTNHPEASNEGPGTIERPWRTIQKAAETAGAGDTVTIHAGLYREGVRPFFGGEENAYLTFRAAPGENQPVLSAAEIWKPEWHAENQAGLFSTAYKRHAWDCPEKWTRSVSGATHAAEQIIVDGIPLLQVDKHQEVRERPGTYLADLIAGRLFLHLPGDPSLEAHIVERAMRQQVFAPAVRGLGYIRLAGLRFVYGSAPEWFGGNWDKFGQRSVVSVRSGHHWIIENNLIEWGNAQGLDIGSEGNNLGDNALEPMVDPTGGHHLVRDNRVNHHAVAGIIGTGQVHDNLIEGNETSFNGWKLNFEAYESAGLKIHAADRCVISKHRAHRNEAFGIWLDWDCKKNRVTECLLTENLAAGFFHEASPGPLLVDGNIILETRSRPDGSWGDGLYCHDGNHATFTGNYVEGSQGYGAHILALAGRTFNGSPTTGSGNRFLNNIFVDNVKGSLSFQPDGALFKDNISEANIFWEKGRAPRMQLEDAGSGVAWEATAIGQSQGRTGGGNLNVPFSDWTRLLGRDRFSVILPLRQMAGFTERGSELAAKIRQLLPKLTAFLPKGLAEPKEVTGKSAQDLTGLLIPALRGHFLARTLWLGPDEALEIWRKGDTFITFHWQKDQLVDAKDIPCAVLVKEMNQNAQKARHLSAGESAVFAATPGTTVAAAPQSFQVVVESESISIKVAKETPAGSYQVIFCDGEGGWRAQVIEIAEPLRLGELQTQLAQHELGLQGIIEVPVQNLSRHEIAVDVHVGFAGEHHHQQRRLQPESTEVITFTTHARTAGLATITIQSDQQKIEHAEAISFVTVRRGGDWSEVTWESLNSFPGGVFPEGAQAFILYETKLTARFALRYDDAALFLRVEANDAKHQQTMPDWQLYLEDGLEILIKPQAGDAPLGPYLFHLALHSEGERQIATFRDRSKAAGLDDPSANRSLSRVTRQAGITTYDLQIPWGMLNLSGPPKDTNPLPLRLSLVLNNNDGYGRHGFEWFFGIFHHAGEDKRMGTVWLTEH